jgi:hypothetical protein
MMTNKQMRTLSEVLLGARSEIDEAGGDDGDGFTAMGLSGRKVKLIRNLDLLRMACWVGMGEDAGAWARKLIEEEMADMRRHTTGCASCRELFARVGLDDAGLAEHDHGG